MSNTNFLNNNQNYHSLKQKSQLEFKIKPKTEKKPVNPFQIPKKDFIKTKYLKYYEKWQNLAIAFQNLKLARIWMKGTIDYFTTLLVLI